MLARSSPERIASPPTVIRPTKSAPTRWRFLRRKTTFPFTSRRRFRLSIYRFQMASTFPLKSVPPRRSRICKACESPPTFPPLIPRSTPRQRGTSLLSSPSEASLARLTPNPSALLPVRHSQSRLSADFFEQADQVAVSLEFPFASG